MDRHKNLESWRIVLLVVVGILILLGVVNFLDGADASTRGIVRFVAAGWTLMMLGLGLYIWETIDKKLELLEKQSGDNGILITAQDSSIIGSLVEFYKTGPVNKILMITGLVIMLAAGAKGGWVDLPSVSVAIGDVEPDGEATPIAPIGE